MKDKQPNNILSKSLQAGTSKICYANAQVYEKMFNIVIH